MIAALTIVMDVWCSHVISFTIIGGTITTIASLFMFNTTIILVRRPSGYMVLAFHWQHVSKFYLILFTYYIVLFMKNKYTIPYRTKPFVQDYGLGIDNK